MDWLTQYGVVGVVIMGVMAWVGFVHKVALGNRARIDGHERACMDRYERNSKILERITTMIEQGRVDQARVEGVLSSGLEEDRKAHSRLHERLNDMAQDVAVLKDKSVR